MTPPELQAEVDRLKNENARLERELNSKHQQALNEVADALEIMAGELRRTHVRTLGMLTAELTLRERLIAALAQGVKGEGQ
jgi:methylphosphotriester-DNA--protein-cysteine methyltransferase